VGGGSGAGSKRFVCMVAAKSKEKQG